MTTMKPKNSLIFTEMCRVGASGDYLRIECAQCFARCSFAFLSMEGDIPNARITCPNHGTLWNGKVDGYDIVATHEALVKEKEWRRRRNISRSLRERKRG